MKHFIVFLTIVFSSLTAFAQNSKDIQTDTFKVDGNCSMCKKRIENAAYVKGVKRAEWNKDTKQLIVTYRPSKTSSDEVLKSVADAGHSSEKVATTEVVYNKLPGCCQYKTNSCND